MNLNQKQINIILYTLVILVVINIGGIIFIKYQSQKHYEELVEGKKIIAQTANTQNIVDIKRKLGSFELVKNKLNEVFISESNPVQFIEFLETLGKESGVVYTTQSVESLDDAGGQKKLNAVFKTEGGWQQIIGFLLKLEALSGFVHLDLIRVSNIISEEGVSSWVLFGQITVPMQ